MSISQTSADSIKLLYRSFESEKLKIDTENFERETEKLRSFQEQAREIRSFIGQSKHKALQQANKLKAAIAELDRQKQNIEKAIFEQRSTLNGQSSQINTLKEKYINNCKQRIAISNTINTSKLSDLQLQDRKSQAHLLFKWIIITFYKQPTSKYYWGNFSQQVFRDSDDKGFDFKQRLGKVSSVQLRQQQRVATQNILKSKQKYLTHPELSPVKEEVEKLIRIAELVMVGNRLAREMAGEDEKIKKINAEIGGKEELIAKSMRKKEAIRDRIQISERYLEVLEEIDRNLAKKEPMYKQVEAEGARMLEASKQPKTKDQLIMIEFPVATKEEPRELKKGHLPPLNNAPGVEKNNCMMF